MGILSLGKHLVAQCPKHLTVSLESFLPDDIDVWHVCHPILGIGDSRQPLVYGRVIAQGHINPFAFGRLHKILQGAEVLFDAVRISWRRRTTP